MCPSGPVGKSSMPVNVLPYYMEVKHAYSGFTRMTDKWSARSAKKETAYILCAMFGVREVNAALRTRRLRWFVNVTCFSSYTNSITSIMIPNARRRGTPKHTWAECVKAYMKICSLDSIDPLNREAWGSDVRHSSHLLPTPVTGIPTSVEN